MKLIYSISTVIFACNVMAGTMKKEVPLSQQSSDITIVAEEISSTMRAHHYNPQHLESEAYKEIEEKTKVVATNTESLQSFVKEFNDLWIKEGPFSHVRLDFAQMDAVSLANYLDSMNVGGQGCSLTWNEDTAVLTVNTMMGNDTIQQIVLAYQKIKDKKAKALIIDLRNNNGGAFAVKPLVGHLIKEPLDVGYFLSQNWTKKNSQQPSKAQLNRIPPWEGWSIKAFWADVVTKGILRIQMQPSETNTFTGPIFVLTSKTTASAAELAVDAMGQLENVIIVGETTAGQMLSQTIIDLSGGLQLSLPIADYFSDKTGRIEGKGVSPDIKVEKEEALKTAFRLINERSE